MIRARTLLPAMCALVAMGATSPTVAQHRLEQGIDRAQDRTAPAPDVGDDIAALARFHGPGTKAAARLVYRGDEVLPRVHAALAAADAAVPQQIQLATVAAQIGDVSSVEPLIALGHASRGEDGVRQAVLDGLSELPSTPAAVSFVESVLADDDESWRVRRKALVFLGRHRVRDAERWVERYRHDGEIELRAAALYVAARLGDTSALRPLADMLAQPAPPSLRYALLLGLAELAGPDAFRHATPDWIRESWEYGSALRYAEFRTSDDTARSALIDRMIVSKALVERQVAAGFILRVRGADELARLTGAGAPPHVRAVARHALRQAGYRIRQDDAGNVRVEPKVRP